MAARRWRRTIALGASVLVVALWWGGTAAHAPVAAAHPASAYGAGVALARAVPPGRAAATAPQDHRALLRAVSERSATFTLAGAALVTPTPSIAPSSTVAPTATAVTPPRGGMGSSRPAAALLWGWVVAALLILVLLGVGLYVLRRMR